MSFLGEILRKEWKTLQKKEKWRNYTEDFSTEGWFRKYPSEDLKFEFITIKRENKRIYKFPLLYIRINSAFVR